MIGFGNDTLNKQPVLKKGDKITCPRCGEQHTVVAGKDSETGDDTNLVMFYKCEGKAYLAGVAGRSVMGVPSDLSREPRALSAVQFSSFSEPVKPAGLDEEQHRQRHVELHLMFDELLADYMLHCPGARPSTVKAMDLMLWSAQQCKSPGGKHPAKASDGALSFNALATTFMSELSGGDMRKRIGPDPLPDRGDFNPEDKWDTVTIPPYANMYDCAEGGKCEFSLDADSILCCEKCGCTPEEKARGEK